MQTIPTSQDYSLDECAIVSLFSEASSQRIGAIQDQLVQILGDAIWLQQPPSLHCTLMEIIGNFEYKDLTRKQHFEAWHRLYSQATRDILATFSPFDITFTELLVSQRAIIIKTADPQSFNDIRTKLLTTVSQPPGTKIPPDITHATIARFTRPLSLEKVQQLTGDITVDITEHIKEFTLTPDLGPPVFNGIPAEVYSLQA